MSGIEFGIILANCITVDTRGTLNVSYSFGDSVQGHKYCVYEDNIIAVLRVGGDDNLVHSWFISHIVVYLHKKVAISECEFQVSDWQIPDSCHLL